MNQTDYLSKKAEIKRRHGKELSNLAMEFVTKNTTTKIGDIVTDHIGSVKVERIECAYGFSDDYPIAVYHGTCYTKTGKPFKSGEERSIWGNNIVRNGK